MKPILDDDLADEYRRLWNRLAIQQEHRSRVNAVAAKLRAHRSRYEAAARPHGMPWQVVAAIHEMESGAKFTKHLHNGDPLSRPTVQVPRGRPPGPGPFTWEESAADALRLKAVRHVPEWDLANTLYFLEGYNGFGYRMHYPEENSPYLWSMSTNSTLPGKYVSDGRFDPTAPSSQVGAALLIRELGLFAPRLTEAGADAPATIPATAPKEGPMFPIPVNVVLAVKPLAIILAIVRTVWAAETKYGAGQGEEKQKFVQTALEAFVLPLLPGGPLGGLAARYVIWPAILGGIDFVVRWLNAAFGPAWSSIVGQVMGLLRQLEPILKKDIDGDGNIG